jgi:multisubunit Na+/H+ antiporter MnhG subunit
VLAAVIQLLASPPAANLLSRATYRADHIPRRLDVIDEGNQSGDLA